MQRIVYVTWNKSTPHKPSTDDFWEMLGKSISIESAIVFFFFFFCEN